MMIWSMHEGDPLKQVSFFIRCSKLKESQKSCTILSSRVILKLLLYLNFCMCLNICKGS